MAIKWSLDLLFAREIEQLVTLRGVEGMETLGATLRAMRDVGESVGGVAGTHPAALEHGRR